MNPLQNWKGLAEGKQSPLTKQQSEVLIHLTFATEEAAQEILDSMSDLFATQVFTKRLQAYNPKVLELIDPKVIILVLSLCSSPGDCVMWAYTLVHLLSRRDWKPLMLDDWVDAFPMGVPDKEESHRIWDHQKGWAHKIKVDNLLDDFGYWPVMEPAKAS